MCGADDLLDDYQVERERAKNKLRSRQFPPLPPPLNLPCLFSSGTKQLTVSAGSITIESDRTAGPASSNLLLLLFYPFVLARCVLLFPIITCCGNIKATGADCHQRRNRSGLGCCCVSTQQQQG